MKRHETQSPGMRVPVLLVKTTVVAHKDMEGTYVDGSYTEPNIIIIKTWGVT